MYQQGSHAFVRKAVEQVFGLWNEGKIKPVVDSTWALEDVPEAMQKMHDRKNIGKIDRAGPEHGAEAETSDAGEGQGEGQEGGQPGGEESVERRVRRGRKEKRAWIDKRHVRRQIR